MRRLLSLTVMAGLAASSAALADRARSQPSAPATTTPTPTDRAAVTPTDPHHPALPEFLRDLLVNAGVMKKPEPEPAMHPWVAWWFRTFQVEPPASIATSPRSTSPSPAPTPAPTRAAEPATRASATASR